MRALKAIVVLIVLMAVVVTGWVVVFSIAPTTQASALSPDHTTGQPAVVMEVLDPTLEQFAPLWRDEIARRFPNAVGVLCHGGDLEAGRWIVKSDNLRHLESTDELAARYKALYPDRTIVLLCCNPGHLHLHVPGVYHATASVWCVPDRDIASHSEASFLMFDRSPATHPSIPGPRRVDDGDGDSSSPVEAPRGGSFGNGAGRCGQHL